jgi:hypothetical protein
MSGADRLVYNNLERALSTDMNDSQSIKDRVLLEELRASWALRITSGGFVGLVDSPRNVVLGGLSTIPAGGNDVSVTPGVLLQDSAVLAPVPGPLDSTYRIGTNRAPTTITIPVPGADTSYLIEGQMIEVVAASEIRDIWNPGLGAFVPALVDKRVERRIGFQLLTGVASQAPAPSGGDWVPIAVVRRQPPFGPLVLADIMQVRPTMAERLPNGQVFFTGGGANRPVSRMRTTHEPGGAASNTIELEAQAYPSGGGRAEFRGAGVALDPTAVEVISPGVVLAANTTYYLYLCPWSAQRLLPEIGTISRGILVLSDVAPSPTGRNNSGAIPLPAPWNVAAAGAFTCVMVASLRRNGANTGWQWQIERGFGETLHERILVANLVPPVLANTIALAGFVPDSARTARVEVNWDVSGAAGPAAALASVSPVGAGLASSYDQVDVGLSVSGSHTFDVPMQPSASFDLNFSAVGALGNATVYLIGWSEG